jgi:hypothetical protein
MSLDPGATNFSVKDVGSRLFQNNDTTEGNAWHQIPLDMQSSEISYRSYYSE